MKKNKILSFVLFFVLCFSIVLSPIQSNGTTFMVINTNDTGAGSLRAAITAANGNGIPDTINFGIPLPGLHTIIPKTPLPTLTDFAGVFINGLSQGGAIIGANPPATLNLTVEISGDSAGTASGLTINCDNNRIQGFIINNFGKDGISVQAGPSANASNNAIFYNIIGLDSSGTVMKGNGYDTTGLWAGVRIYNLPGFASTANNNFIVDNLISGNHPYADGVQIVGPQESGDVFGNFVVGNYIGTDITGTVDLGNAHEGVCLCEGTHDNLVDSNLVSGNDYDGVGIQGYNNEPFPLPPIQTQLNIVINNIIGLAIDAVTPLPNSCHGVAIGEYGPSKWGCADYNVVGPGNIIAYNGWDGVSVWEDPINAVNADGNHITQNSIFDNDSLGIDLQNDGVTLNDLGDSNDWRGNQELNFPVIDSAVYLAGNTTVYGKLDIDTDPTLATIEIFKANSDPTGYGEGETYLGSATPNPSGDWYVTVSGLIVGDSVTATTTDTNINTSEFCLNHIVTASTGIEETSIEGNPLKVSSPLLINSVEISFTVKKKGKVKVGVYDIAGKLIKNLVDKECAPSSYSVSWDGKNAKGENLPAGAYICKLESEDDKAARKIIKIIK
jgi:hypothetical protein